MGFIELVAYEEEHKSANKSLLGGLVKTKAQIIQVWFIGAIYTKIDTHMDLVWLNLHIHHITCKKIKPYMGNSFNLVN